MPRKGGKAKKYKNLAWVFGILLLVGLFAGVAMFSASDGNLPRQEDDGGDVVVTGDCNTAPTLSVATRNALEQGSSVSTGTLYRVNDVYYGDTAPNFRKGDKVEMILNASGYIDEMTEEITMDCGSNKISELVYAHQDAAVEVKEDSTVLTDEANSTASNKGSAVASGGSETFQVSFTGHDKKTTGDFIYVVELSTNDNVSNVNLYDANGQEVPEVDVPSFYDNSLSSPYKKAFKMSAIEGAKEKTYSMTIVSKSGKTIDGSVYTTAYVGEPLVEDDGSFVNYGVEDSTGSSDYEATFDYDINLA